MAYIRMLWPFVILALGVAGRAAAAPGGSDPLLKGQLESISRARVYFGHQSVGYNVVQGLAELAAEAGVPLRIFEISDSLRDAPTGFLHGRVGRNTDPVSKLESFRRTVASAPGVDVALLKFCYVDFDDRTDAAALFARYQAAIAELRAVSPGTKIVHVTAPLTTVQGGLKAFVKELIGREPYGLADNLRREQYNELLRRAYEGREPVLDVARIESTTPDGRRFTVESGGKAVPAMVPAYTDDGGHLGPQGRRRVALELVSVLASVAPRSPGAATTR
jgi:hypothetical protein